MMSWGPVRGAIEIYGRRWCAHTQMIRRMLERHGIPYTYHDMDHDPNAAARVRWWTGYDVNPVVVAGGRVLVEPSLDQVEWIARRMLALAV